MAGNTSINVTNILNRVAAEVGIAPVTDPIASQDPLFVQLRYLLNTAGEELMQAYPWEILTKSHRIQTVAGDSGVYTLPSDYGYILNQTQWDRSKNVPLGGPLSPQQWTYLKGRDLASNTLYASFRISQGKFNIFPENPPAGLDLNFEYQSCAWVFNGDDENPVYTHEVELASDVPLFDKTLITRALKVKYLESGGFDTTKAQADYNQIFAFLTGTDKAAPILNAGRKRGGFPLLSAYNVGDTGFGL
jgi:hypothetical protein